MTKEVLDPTKGIYFFFLVKLIKDFLNINIYTIPISLYICMYIYTHTFSISIALVLLISSMDPYLC